MRITTLVTVLAAAAGTAGELKAQDSQPPGPPWTEVCAPMEQEGFRSVFTSDECHEDFLRTFAASSADATHRWMKSQRACFREWDHFSWLAFARHDQKMAQLAWDHQLHMVKQRLIGPTDCDERACVAGEVQALLERGLNGEIGDEAKAHTGAFLDEVERNQSYKPMMDKAYGAVTAICAYHLNLECAGAMRKILDWMYPRSYRLDDPDGRVSFTFSMLPFYREGFTDQATQRGATRLALELLNAIESGEAVTASQGDLVTRGLAAFDGDAERFWKFMIVYATRGAAWAAAYQMAHADNAPLFAAHMVISAALGYLDTLDAEDGTAFSYGPAPTSTCFQPKPYHYWMAAGYAWLLKREGYSDRTVRLVPRLLGAMYELGSTTTGRSPDDVFFVPTFDVKVNRTRRELAHHALGTELGRVFPQLPRQDFDAALLTLMEESKPLPDVSDDEMRRRIGDAMTKWKLWTALTGYYAF